MRIGAPGIAAHDIFQTTQRQEQAFPERQRNGNLSPFFFPVLATWDIRSIKMR
jgi:hypothetical protein